jgi:hypothetical protein
MHKTEEEIEREEQEVWDRFAASAIAGSTSRFNGTNAIVCSAAQVADAMLEQRRARIEHVEDKKHQKRVQARQDHVHQDPTISNGAES